MGPSARLYGRIRTGSQPPGRPGWRKPVEFAAGGAYAYRPGQVLIRAGELDEAQDVLVEILRQALGIDETVARARISRETSPSGRWVRLTGPFDALGAVRTLRGKGIYAQANHLFFATSLDASPFYGSPFYGSPFYGSPFYGSPFYGSPFYGSPVAAGPFVDPGIRHSGPHRNVAQPAPRPHGVPGNPGRSSCGVKVAVLDTGWAQWSKRPRGLRPRVTESKPDRWDDNRDGYLDPVAGHGTFIAGIIEMLTPGCELWLPGVMTGDGVVEEWDAAFALEDLEEDPPHLVDLSFAGYLPHDEPPLLPDGGQQSRPPEAAPASAVGAMAEAIQALLSKGTIIVASAGNDGTAAPTLPAAFPGVIAVASLDERGYPAPYTNHGPWVDACAVGSNVVSLFFRGVTDREREFYDVEPDTFNGWARWSGTSFAAPKVVAALAWEIASRLATGNGSSTDTEDTEEDAHRRLVARQALQVILGSPSAPNRYALLGTVVVPNRSRADR